MSRRSWFIVAFIAAGALLVHYGRANLAVREWVPIERPFPGEGAAVTQSFEIRRGGRFTMAVNVPGAGPAEQPPVACNLTLTITGKNGFRVDQSIRSVQLGAWRSDLHRYFPPDPLVLPSGGKYSFTLRNAAAAGVFRQRGVMLVLEREEPVGREFGYAIAQGLGYVLLGVAALLAFTRR
jgi:hypothetical protein